MRLQRQMHGKFYQYRRQPGKNRLDIRAGRHQLLSQVCVEQAAAEEEPSLLPPPLHLPVLRVAQDGEGGAQGQGWGKDAPLLQVGVVVVVVVPVLVV